VHQSFEIVLLAEKIPRKIEKQLNKDKCQVTLAHDTFIVVVVGRRLVEHERNG
jgi:hypothetical protein